AGAGNTGNLAGPAPANPGAAGVLEGAGHTHHDRQLRHRQYRAAGNAGTRSGCAEDRQGVRAPSAAPARGFGDHLRHHQPGAQPGHRCRGRWRGNRRTAGLPEVARVPERAGLYFQPAGDRRPIRGVAEERELVAPESLAGSGSPRRFPAFALKGKNGSAMARNESDKAMKYVRVGGPDINRNLLAMAGRLAHIGGWAIVLPEKQLLWSEQ